MIKHLLGRRRGRKKEEQEDDNIILQPFRFADEIKTKAAPDIRQNVVKEHAYPFLLSGNGMDKKIWIEAETYDAALLRAQGIAELLSAKLTEVW